MNGSLDDIAAYLPNVEIKSPRTNHKVIYYQKMQSRYGGRKFTLMTDAVSEYRLVISLYDETGKGGILIGTRSAIRNDEQAISKAIKSLERKAGCKLYYVLLISTDGDYL